jgi:hypothetical protein
VTSRHTKLLRPLERAKARGEIERRQLRRSLAVDRRTAAFVEVRGLRWPRVHIGSRANGTWVQGETEWRALLDDIQVDVAAIEAALSDCRCLFARERGERKAA